MKGEVVGVELMVVVFRLDSKMWVPLEMEREIQWFLHFWWTQRVGCAVEPEAG